MVEEECAELVVDVGDGLSVVTVSCLGTVRNMEKVLKRVLPILMRIGKERL